LFSKQDQEQRHEQINKQKSISHDFGAEKKKNPKNVEISNFDVNKFKKKSHRPINMP